jgi:hypothetical protein
MTFFDFITENRTKLLGTATTLVAGILGMIASGMFDDLLTEIAIKWMAVLLSIANIVLGGSTIATGFANTTRERVATAAATVEVAKANTASAMKTVSTGGAN